MWSFTISYCRHVNYDEHRRKLYHFKSTDTAEVEALRQANVVLETRVNSLQVELATRDRRIRELDERLQ